MRTNKGFTLVELLVAMVVFIVVLGAAMSFLVTQSRTFRRGSDEMAVLQNMSFGADNLDSQMRTAGSNTVDNQPTVVYASANTFSFNSELRDQRHQRTSSPCTSILTPPLRRSRR